MSGMARTRRTRPPAIVKRRAAAPKAAHTHACPACYRPTSDDYVYCQRCRETGADDLHRGHQ